MLSETEPLIIRTFGEFSIRQGDNIISESDNRSKKLWKLLQYVVHNRNRRISREELLTLLWQEHSGREDQTSSLKTLLCRVRNALDRLNFEESRRVILLQDGGYIWNPRLPVKIDTEDFLELAERAKTTDLPEEKLNAALRAMALYKGRYLSGKYADEPWAREAADHYETQYLYCYNAAVEILAGEGRYDQIVFLSRHAMEIDPGQESFYYNEISALIAKGEGKEALSAYDRAMDRFYQVYRQTPSDRLRNLYRNLRRVDNGIEPDLSIVREKLDADRADRVIRCEYDTFKLLYRQLAGTGSGGTDRYLILLTVVSPDRREELPAANVLERALAALEDSLLENLAPGDVYTRYSLTQLLVLAAFPDEDGLTYCLSKLLRAIPAHEAGLAFRTEKL
ncbi:MAG: winged helix-turn-helix domain-containing protein [Clostridia bacterium]|nr:winged helix-turn-helix domain-containing protein [Clostridia bacterium]